MQAHWVINGVMSWVRTSVLFSPTGVLWIDIRLRLKTIRKIKIK